MIRLITLLITLLLCTTLARTLNGQISNLTFSGNCFGLLSLLRDTTQSLQVRCQLDLKGLQWNSSNADSLPTSIQLGDSSIVSGAAKFQSGYKYFKNIDGWLKLHRVPTNWQDARIRCQAEGGILASPTTEPMLASMKEMMNVSGTLPCGVFTGIHATFSKGDYYTIDGIPVSQIPAKWAADDPRSIKHKTAKCPQTFKDCLILFSPWDGTLSDVECTDNFPFICYKRRSVKKENCTCGTRDPAYGLHPKTGSCYKFHRAGQTWNQAFKTCSMEGGHLAIINSVTEAQILKELFAKQPENTIGSQFKSSAMLGFLDWGGAWSTIHGQTLQEAGYPNWSAGQPDSAKSPSGKPGQPCGAMFRTGLLDDVWCDLPFAFICERRPEGGDESDYQQKSSC